MLPNPLDVAMKEWAAVVSAVVEGRQVMLLRKGGIHEGRAGFQMKHDAFAFLPTYLHQSAEQTKPAERHRLQPLAEEPEAVHLAYAAEVTDVLVVPDRPTMDRLVEEHIWAEPYIDLRFNYKPQSPLFLVIVRPWVLASPVEVANDRYIAGCRSWVPLRQPIETGRAEPALPADLFDAKRARVLDLLRQPAA